jgi:E3 ubiquitin-protein ligase DOA10
VELQSESERHKQTASIERRLISDMQRHVAVISGNSSTWRLLFCNGLWQNLVRLRPFWLGILYFLRPGAIHIYKWRLFTTLQDSLLKLPLTSYCKQVHIFLKMFFNKFKDVISLIIYWIRKKLFSLYRVEQYYKNVRGSHKICRQTAGGKLLVLTNKYKSSLSIRTAEDGW